MTQDEILNQCWESEQNYEHFSWVKFNYVWLIRSFEHKIFLSLHRRLKKDIWNRLFQNIRDNFIPF